MADSRVRNWVFVMYPESMPENWVDQLTELHVPAVVSPLHDKDKNADGTDKKPHYHVLLCFDGKKSFEQVKEISQGVFHGTIPQDCKNVRGQVRYFIHMDNPEKFQYPMSGIRAFNGADIDKHFNLSSVCRHDALRDMRRFIRQNSIYSFADFLDYCDDNCREWAELLDDNSTMVISQYIKSRIYDRRDTLSAHLEELASENARLQNQLTILDKKF